MMPPAFADAAFWVTLTFITVVDVHGYAHKMD